jgi:hypothetical protein
MAARHGGPIFHATQCSGGPHSGDTGGEDCGDKYKTDRPFEVTREYQLKEKSFDDRYEIIALE